MPEYRRNLDIYQGYNFKKDRQTPVGFITKLQIGLQSLAVDQTVKDPTDPTEDLKVVSVMSGVLWETGPTDAVYLSGQVSVPNRQDVAMLMFSDLTNVQVVFQFTVYDYDPVAKKYFRAFHGDGTDLMGLVEKRGDEHSLSIADEPSLEVQSPENYAFQIGIKPQPSAQTLHIAIADQTNLVKAWGP
ncbi:MAG: hypothetical protein KC933_00680 [Myxococcales bacterium]|nr:hypothetical protein [Myxococcales bacterium]